MNLLRNLAFFVFFHLVKNDDFVIGSGAKLSTNAKLDVVYNGTVKDGIEDIYFFNLTDSRLKHNGVRVIPNTL